MKSLKINDEIHNILKNFCKENNLKINSWVESLIKKEIKNDKRKTSLR